MFKTYVSLEVYRLLTGAQNLRLAAEIREELPAHVGMRCYVKLSECCICGDHMLDGVYDVGCMGEGESNVKNRASP